MHPYARAQQWSFHGLAVPNHVVTTWLGLNYEIDDSTISDDYVPAEMDARALWGLWLDRLDLANTAKRNPVPACDQDTSQTNSPSGRV